ncbi:MAG: ATP synthase subunit I [Oscillospiraceae bacterium]
MSEVLKKEAITMTIGIVVLCAIMLAIFSVLGYYDSTALYGAMLGGGFAIVNFILLGITVQKVTKKSSPKSAQSFQSASYALRLILTAAVVIIGIKVDIFNYLTVFIPLFFPRIVIFFSNILRKEE